MRTDYFIIIITLTMLFSTTLAVFFSFLAAVEGVSGASASSRPGSAQGLARTFQEIDLADLDTDNHHNIDNTVLRRFHSYDNDVYSELMGVVKRAEVSVSEADILQLIEDVDDVRNRLLELLSTAETPGSSPTDDQNLPSDFPQPGDAPQDEVPTPAVSESPAVFPQPSPDIPSSQNLNAPTPEVSPTSTPQRLTTVLGPFDPIEAEPTSTVGGVSDWTGDHSNDDSDTNDETGSEDEIGGEFTTVTATMTSDIDCTTTITHTFTEFFHDGPSTLTTSLRAPSDLEDGRAFPTESVAVDEFPEDDNLVPFDFGEDNETESVASLTTLVDLWEAAAPTVTEPPSPNETTEFLGEGSESEGGPEPSQESSAIGRSGSVAGEEGSSRMTLRFPEQGPSSIVWRTIPLPVPQNRGMVSGSQSDGVLVGTRGANTRDLHRRDESLVQGIEFGRDQDGTKRAIRRDYNVRGWET